MALCLSFTSLSSGCVSFCINMVLNGVLPFKRLICTSEMLACMTSVHYTHTPACRKNRKANNWSKELRDAFMKPARNTSTQVGTRTKPTCSSSDKGKTSPQEIQFPIPRLQPHWLNADWRLFNHLQENVCAYLRPEKIKIRFWSGSLIMEILRRNTELITCHLHLQRKLQVSSTWCNWNSTGNLLTTTYQSLYIFPQVVRRILEDNKGWAQHLSLSAGGNLNSEISLLLGKVQKLIMTKQASARCYMLMM